MGMRVLAAMLFSASTLTVMPAPVVMPDGTVFDAEYYAQRNPDVAAICGTDEALLYQHYTVYGRAEGRAPFLGAERTGVSSVPDGTIFDPDYYAANNPDVVVAVGGTETALYRHYMDYGRFEGRAACAPGTEAASVYVPSAYAYAEAVLDEVGWDAKAAFDWSAGLTYYGHGKADMPENGDPGTNWFAEFGFTKHKGNCYVMAATFCQMARLMGYDVQQVSGWVPSRRGGLTPHSWVEVYIDGQTYVCDPDFTYDTKRNGFMIQYRQPGTWMYTNYAPMRE